MTAPEENRNPDRCALIELAFGSCRFIAVVFGYLVMQTQKRLETVQSELHEVSENAVRAKARVVV